MSKDHGMFLRRGTSYEWRVGGKADMRGYICVAKCKKGFTWYNSVQKCVRVVDQTPETRK